ncbi:hypothetical protein [Rubripirellula tenax]|uniref:hypothetical protein n=1 Tax=Rubripirellula tenax TaxID=2528015 RepID=UPI001FE43303|nr:hypothetical protein [Rubripirellula tenax]
MVGNPVLIGRQDFGFDVFGPRRQLIEDRHRGLLVPAPRCNFLNKPFTVAVLGRPRCRFGSDPQHTVTTGHHFR